MTLVIQTKKDDPNAFELAGAGVAGANGKGGIVVESAAQVAADLQEKNADGSLKVDGDGHGVPLKGNALAAAAKKFAKARGVEVNDVSDKAIANFGTDLGGAPDRPAAEKVSKELFERQTAGHESASEAAEAEAAAEGSDQ